MKDAQLEFAKSIPDESNLWGLDVKEHLKHGMDSDQSDDILIMSQIVLK